MSRSFSDRRESGGDQRFLTFLLLSVSILMFSQMFFPSAPPPKKPDQAAEANAEPEDDSPDEANGEADPQAAGDAGDAQPGDPPPIEAGPEVEPQIVSLGSGEVDGPYRMLLTLNNVGGAVQRAELSTHEFRDLDNRSGYLGELSLTEAGPKPSDPDDANAEPGEQLPGQSGPRVSVVGAGTPAHAAGLQAGDILLSARTKPSDQRALFPKLAAFDKWLAKTKPGQEVELTYLRDGKEQSASVQLVRRPLALIRPESENIRLHSPKLAETAENLPSFLVKLEEVGNLDADDAELKEANERLATSAWEVAAADARNATFRMRLAKLGLEIEKHFRLVEVPEAQRGTREYPAYHFEFDVVVRNLLAKSQSVAYRLQGPNGLPIEGWWYANRIGRTPSGSGSWGAVGIRDVIARYEGSNFVQYRCSDIVDGDAQPMGQGASLAYLGVDAQYFSVILIPEKKSFDEVWFDIAQTELATPELPEKGTLPTYNNTTFTATRKAVKLKARGSKGDTLEDEFRVFAGPKRPKLLEQYVPAGDTNYGLQNVLYYGWFAPVSSIMLRLLHTFYGIVQNYGIAIIMLTVLVRGAMFPLSRKQAMNMAKMQELKPEMDRIAEKYKTDMEKRSKAQQELFRKHNYNPMGGCLLMFLQLPIFIGLYRALAVDIELRQAPLFGESIRFCSNLGAPDQFYDWSWLMPQWFNNGQGLVALGPYFNLLPILTIVLFLLQQKMFMPEPTNDQAAMQQKMMKYMMIFFGIMFFKVPSGLCLYFIASSLWGITERKLLPKPTAPAADTGFSKPKTPASKKPAGTSESKPKSSGQGGKNKKKKKRR